MRLSSLTPNPDATAERRVLPPASPVCGIAAMVLCSLRALARGCWRQTGVPLPASPAAPHVRGGIAVLLVLSLMLLTTMMLLIVDLGRLSVSRARLQAAADRAAFAGAASLADSLDRMAVSNWRLHKAFRDLEDDFASDSQQDVDAAQQRIEEYEAARDASLAEIDGLRDGMAEKARASSAATLAANAPASDAEIRVAVDVQLSADADPDEQWRTLAYDVVTGPSFIDPESTEGGTYEALRYLRKEAAPDASVGILATTEVQPLFLEAALGSSMEVRAQAAAQAFGGAIDAFALKETDDEQEAEALIDDDGYDGLYRASVVPAWTQGGLGISLED
jgi:Flp pilus assembly protein TadG